MTATPIAPSAALSADRRVEPFDFRGLSPDIYAASAYYVWDIMPYLAGQMNGRAGYPSIMMNAAPRCHEPATALRQIHNVNLTFTAQRALPRPTCCWPSSDLTNRPPLGGARCEIVVAQQH